MTHAIAIARAWALPTPGDIKELIMKNERIAALAIVCATIITGLAILVVGAVAIMGGDFAALALAIGGLVTVIAGKSIGRKGGGKDGGPS